MRQQDGRGVGRERSSGLADVQHKAPESLPGKRTLVEQEYARGRRQLHSPNNDNYISPSASVR